jgi:hypothetical protein
MTYNPKKRELGAVIAPLDIPGHAVKAALLALEQIAQDSAQSAHDRVLAASTILSHVRVEDCDW